MSAASTGAPAGLVHHGLLHDGADELVETVVPGVRRALDAGEDVYLTVDRRTARLFRAALGRLAERVTFPPPVALLPASSPEFVRTLRRWCRGGRRATLLGEYPAGIPRPTSTFGDDALNSVLADLPMTVICACPRDAADERVAALRHAHPSLLTAAGPSPNPEFRPPATASPVPPGFWGTVALQVGFGGTEDLRDLRRRVAQVALDAGLRGDAVRAAVLAVHEAALLACRTAGPACDPNADLSLELRARPGTLFAEVHGPRPPDADASAETAPLAVPSVDGDVPEPRAATDRDDPLAHLRPFCAEAAVHDDADQRAVRVLTTV